MGTLSEQDWLGLGRSNSKAGVLALPTVFISYRNTVVGGDEVFRCS